MTVMTIAAAGREQKCESELKIPDPSSDLFKRSVTPSSHHENPQKEAAPVKEHMSPGKQSI